MWCADVSIATSGFEDAFDNFPASSTSAAESDVASTHAAPAAEASFGDFADLDVAQSNGASAPTKADSAVKKRSVADLIAQLPDLSYMLEYSVASRGPA